MLSSAMQRLLSLVWYLATLPWACICAAAGVALAPLRAARTVRNRALGMMQAAELLEREREHSRALAEDLAVARAKLSVKRRELKAARLEGDETRQRADKGARTGAGNGAAHEGTELEEGAGAQTATAVEPGRGDAKGMLFVSATAALFVAVSFSRGGVLSALETKLLTAVAIPMVILTGLGEGARSAIQALCIAWFMHGVLLCAYLRSDDPRPVVPWSSAIAY